MTEIYRTDEKFRQNYEQQGVHLIMFQPLDILLIAGKTLFDKPETLRGKQIRLVGDAQDILPKVGAQPISIAYEETYESLERGVIDGHAMNFEGIVDIRTDEVAKNMVDAGIGQVTAMNLVISSDVWADFSDEDKKIIEDATADTFDNMSQIYRDLNSAHCDGMVAQGANFFSWSDEDKAFWRDASAQEQIDKWTAKQSDKAYAAEFLDRYKTLMAEFGELDDEERAFIREQMAAPVDAAALAREVPQGFGPQVYLMSLMAIEFDNRKEAEYLHRLAQGLGLDKETVNGIHQKVGVINLYA